MIRIFCDTDRGIGHSSKLMKESIIAYIIFKIPDQLTLQKKQLMLVPQIPSHVFFPSVSRCPRHDLHRIWLPHDILEEVSVFFSSL